MVAVVSIVTSTCLFYNEQPWHTCLTDRAQCLVGRVHVVVTLHLYVSQLRLQSSVANEFLKVRSGSVAGCCELSGSVKDGEYLHMLSDCQLLEDCFIEFVMETGKYISLGISRDPLNAP